MKLVTSKMPPLKLSNPNFAEIFSNLLDCSTRVDIAVGYITSDSLAWFHEAMKRMTNINTLNLVIGMHYWDRFTEREYKTALEFDNYLRSENRGALKLVKSYKYHGKLYSWSDDSGVISGIIGSNNLGSITAETRSYEVSALFDEQNDVEKIKSFIDELTQRTTVDLQQYEVDGREYKMSTDILEGHDGVSSVDNAEKVLVSKSKTNIEFKIPLKGVNLSKPRNNRDLSRSNLNCFFGKGRESKNGRVLPRPWYEVELIPGKAITSLPNYPNQNESFKVITYDGWKFDCQVHGGDDGKKNFRSEGDLQTLGMWIKGHMETAGVLDIGHLVTTDTIQKFGKNVIVMTKTAIDNTWFLEFGEV